MYKRAAIIIIRHFLAVIFTRMIFSVIIFTLNYQYKLFLEKVYTRVFSQLGWLRLTTLKGLSPFVNKMTRPKLAPDFFHIIFHIFHIFFHIFTKIQKKKSYKSTNFKTVFQRPSNYYLSNKKIPRSYLLPFWRCDPE